MKYDMHLHTTHSDGELTPEQVVEKAIEKKLSGISITDHDSISAIEIASEYINKNNYELDLITGIEFGTNYNSDEVHILGYFIDHNNKDLIDVLKNLNSWRRERSKLIINELNKIGFKIKLSDIVNEDSNFTGRVYIAKELVCKGYVENLSLAFENYLGSGKSCYIAKKTYSIKQIINIIKNAGGVAILAHPILLKNYYTLEHVVRSGIDGLECIHSKQTIADTLSFMNYSKENNLIFSGGSDCHGRLESKNKNLMLGEYYITDQELKKMRRLSNDRKKY